MKYIVEIEISEDEHPHITSVTCNGAAVEGESDSMGRASGEFFELPVNGELVVNVVEWYT